jgi:hypothetical protein
LNTLENHALENDYLIVKKCFDIASGLNDGHQGLLRLLRLCASGVVDRVLITYDDRLARFGAHTHLSDQAKVKQKPLTLLLEGYAIPRNHERAIQIYNGQDEEVQSSSAVQTHAISFDPGLV